MIGTIEWDSGFDTGNVMVDREHHQLIALANILLSTNSTDHNDAIMNETLQALHRYVNRHFENEENLLEATSSRHLETQRHQHRTLSMELNTLWNPGLTTASHKTVNELVSWVQNRLVRHFIVHDGAAFSDFPFAETPSVGELDNHTNSIS